VYIHTARGVLIEVNPHVRIPRTFKRFGGLMGEYDVVGSSFMSLLVSLDMANLPFFFPQFNYYTSSASAVSMAPKNFLKLSK
jgi:EMG1/NEP1 methyltransferase